MEETYQLTSALKFIPWGQGKCRSWTDARFSGVSTGACIGHVGPEALAGGPLGKLRDGDVIAIEVDRNSLSGSVQFIGTVDGELSAEQAQSLLKHAGATPGFGGAPGSAGGYASCGRLCKRRAVVFGRDVYMMWTKIHSGAAGRAGSPGSRIALSITKHRSYAGSFSN